VARASFFVAPVIAGSVIAVLPVAIERELNKGAWRGGVISAAPPDGSIIAPGSGPTAAVWPVGDTFRQHLPACRPICLSPSRSKKT
jgi:hypothetical protein